LLHLKLPYVFVFLKDQKPETLDDLMAFVDVRRWARFLGPRVSYVSTVVHVSGHFLTLNSDIEWIRVESRLRCRWL